MPAVVVEEIGRSAQASESSSRTRRYFARGATDEADALGAVLTFLQNTIGNPPDLANLTLKNLSCDEEVEDGYRCEASWGQYQRREPPQTGESQFNFEVAVQPVKIVVPLVPQTVYKRSDDPWPLPADIDRWLIADQGDGNAPEGAEVFEPVTSFSETHYVPDATISPTYRDTIMRIVSKTNNAVFKGWQPGECLCQGVSGSKRGSADWELTYRFATRENQTDITVAGITGITKQGWQFLWPRYLKKVDGDAKVVTNVVRYIVVATVFREANFADLGIGT